MDAALREQFNAFGAKTEDLKKTKLKSEMKQLFQKSGVPVVPGAVIKTNEDVDKSVKEIGLPMIAKQIMGLVHLQPSNLKQKMISITLSLSGIMKQFIFLKNL